MNDETEQSSNPPLPRLVNGTIRGNGADIETWVRLYWTAGLHAPVERLGLGNGTVFRLILRGHVLLQGGNITVPVGQIEVAEWSNGTSDARMWVEQPDAYFGDRQEEFQRRRSFLSQLSVEMLEKFPYVSTLGAGSTSDPENKGGRPRWDDDEWARKEYYEKKRPKSEIFAQWSQRPGVIRRDLVNKYDSFEKALQRKPKGINREDTD